MKKYLNRLKNNVRINKNLFVFLLVLVIVGVGAGAVFSSILSKSDAKMVAEYLKDFMKNVGKENVTSSLLSTLISRLGLGLIIWIFGISIIGVILIIPIVFIKSFVLGFSIGSIILNFKFKGVLISLIYIVPHHVINMLIYILISAYGIIISTRLFDSMKKKKNFDFKKFMNRYTYILVFSFVILLLTSLYEVYALPKILRFASQLIK